MEIEFSSAVDAESQATVQATATQQQEQTTFTATTTPADAYSSIREHLLQANTQPDVIQQLDNIYSEHSRATHLEQSILSLQDQLQHWRRHATQLARSQTPPTPPHYQQSNQDKADKLKIDMPQPFDGTPHKMKRWIFEITQYCTIKKWINHTRSDVSSKITAAQFTVTRLTGKAVIWWQSECAKDSNLLSHTQFNRLIEMIENEFTDVDRDRKLLSKFDRLSQIKDVYTYVSAFRQVCLELGSLITDDQKLFRFIQGLKPEVQQHVLLQTDVTTLSEAILLAERVQQAQDFQKYGTIRKQSNKQPRDYSTPMELGNVARPRNNNNQRYSNNKGKQPVHYHNQKGKQPQQNANMMRQQQNYYQRSNQQYNQASSSKGRYPTNSRTPFTCYYCGKANHYARDCYSRKRDMKLHSVEFPPPPNDDSRPKNC